MKITDIKKLIQDATLKDFSYLSDADAMRKYQMFNTNFPSIDNLLILLSDLEETDENCEH